MAETSRNVELLAPAGSIECLHAAVSGGADAVYLGLDSFNARRNAANFTLDDLREACDYAHLRGVSVYVTMNVEILPGELDSALRLAMQAYGAGADALIVADIGLARMLAKDCPEIRVHASTQMNMHSAAGIEAAARLGARRVTLARELSIEEIAELAEVAAAFGMEVETFAHGALCVCYSGQCLMSSMIGGRSANRGLCAQACRLPYELHSSRREGALPAPGEHLLSPRDLCTIDLLDQLKAAGVSSLKIEGRMKSADYVFAVTSVYRDAIDSGMGATDAQRARLAEAFSRGFTTAYLEGERGNEIMSYARPNNRGVFAGRVARVADGAAWVSPALELHDGDVLEFWTNKGHGTATVTDARSDRDGAIRVPVDMRIGKGDRVFRVRNAQEAFHDDAREPRVCIEGAVRLHVGSPLEVRFSSSRSASRECGTADVVSASARGEVVEQARTRAVTEQDVRDHVDRLGNTPFSLASLDVELDENVGIGFSQLHRVRAEALELLEQRILAPYRRETPTFARVREADANREPRQRGGYEVMAWATNPSCARVARRAGAAGVYVPLLNFRRGQSAIAGVRQDDPEQAGYPKQCIMALPTVDHDPIAPAREYRSAFDPWDYVREGKRVFADSLASVIRALECGAQVEAGPHVLATNGATLAYLAELGVSRVWLSPELTLGQIDDLARRAHVPLGLFVSGFQELMITEHCLLMSQGPCNEECETCPRRSASHVLRDRKGFEFPVVTDMLGRSHLYNGIELDVNHNACDLVDIGIGAVMVDTTLCDKKAASAAVGRAVRARDLAVGERKSIGKRTNTTTGHLYRGVS